MRWDRLLNEKRLGETASSLGADDVRTEFERDADRVMFCGPFRRMSRKTQVHPLAANDHVHTRLTHSLETGQVGKALGKKLHRLIKKDLPQSCAPEDLSAIVQAACLAHDIGNPPFGHAGEEAMSHWFRTNGDQFAELPKEESYDLSRFDGNAQGFRILTQIENHVFAGGMQLTYATIATFLKYPYLAAPGRNKFSVFHSEKSILDEVAANVELTEIDGKYSRHPLAYLVEAADDICYCVLDLEDAVELKILAFSDAADILLRMFDSKERELIEQSFAGPEMFRVNFARMRGKVFQKLGQAAIEGFMSQYDEIMEGTASVSVFERLGPTDPRAAFIAESKKTGRTRIYNDVKKVEVELGAYTTLESLLSDFCDAATDCAVKPGLAEKQALQWKSQLVMGLLGDHAPGRGRGPTKEGWTAYACHRRAIDFVSGMTDNYATYLAKQIRGMGFTGLQRP